jgi:hypothetical protein
VTPLHPRRNAKRSSSSSSSRSGNRAPAGAAPRRPGDFWRAVPVIDVPEPITPAVDPTALLRSLGPPPLAGQADAARYIGAVVERAAGLATALAVQADILAGADG